MRCRFVQPDLVRVPLTDGDWIDVKKELTTGEQREMFGEMRRQFAPGEEPVVDGVQIGRARSAAYIIAWSFVDADGTPVPYSRAAYDALDTATSKEINQAINAHEDRVATERQEKKLTTPLPSFAATSPSVV